MLKVGFARKTINPEPGVGLCGYFITRLSEKVHDDLEASAIVFSNGDRTAVLASLDLCELETGAAARIRKAMADAFSIPIEAVFLTCTHTHTSPFIGVVWEKNSPQDRSDEYTDWLIGAVAETCREAFADLTEARIGYAVGKAEGIAFSRRFLMKDGSIATNPGLHNPDIVKIIGEPDTALPVIRIDREKSDTVVIANFGCHPDTVGGNDLSADWPGVFRRTFEKAVPGTKAVFVNGAEGEINHINVFATEEELHGMKIDFDAVPRGFGHTEYMGKAVADAVLAVYDKVTWTGSDRIGYSFREIEIPTNRVIDEKKLAEAHRINDLHLAGKDAELPFKGMYLTTAVAEADRICNLEFGPDSIPTWLSVLTVGGIAFAGIAGEPFSAIGRSLKEAKGFNLVVPCALTNGYTGYFPNQEAYAEGGYEAQSSPFAAGVAEILIREGTSLLEESLQL